MTGGSRCKEQLTYRGMHDAVPDERNEHMVNVLITETGATVTTPIRPEPYRLGS